MTAGTNFPPEDHANMTTPTAPARDGMPEVLRRIVMAHIAVLRARIAVLTDCMELVFSDDDPEWKRCAVELEDFQFRAINAETALAQHETELATLRRDAALELQRRKFMQQHGNCMGWGLVGPKGTPFEELKPGCSVTGYFESPYRNEKLGFAYYADHNGDRDAAECAAIDMAIAEWKRRDEATAHGDRAGGET